MALNISSSKAKVDEIVRNVKDYGVLVDDVRPGAKVEGLACVPGLGMHAEAESLRGLSNDLDSGLFKLLVMGKFKNGKSTFINALLGKMMMAAKTTATTAVIAMVEFGNREKQVQVYESGKDQPRVISLDQFTEEFALTDKDQEIIEGGGDVDRFAHIDHVVMQSSGQMFEDGVRLIDSPGLEEAHARTKTTAQFVPKANAIIFTLTATALFSAAERKYINENFVGKGLRNVFFVVNRIDNLNSPDALEKNVKPAVRAHLEGVFTDENGRFDEELYNKRVFYTNAFGALCLRTGEPYTVLVGKKPVPVEIEMADTGMVEFEKALTDFLNSDERLHATFQSTLTSMANFYQAADKKIASEKKAHSLPLQELEQNAKEAQTVLDDLRDDVAAMKKDIKTSGGLISGKVYNNLLNFVQNDIPREFEAIVENEAVPFGMGNMMKMAWTSLSSIFTRRDNSEEQAKILKPIIDKVNEYISRQMHDWEGTIPTLVEQDLADLENEINMSVAEFDMGLASAIDIFANGNAKMKQTEKTKGGTLQSILALTRWDVSLAVEGMAGGGMRWGEFMKRMLLQFGLDYGVWLLVQGPYLIPALIVEIVSMGIRSKKMGKDLLKQIGAKAFEQLRDRITKEELTFKKGIADKFAEESDTICSTAIQLIDTQEAELNKILDAKRKGEKNAADEAARQDKVLAAMRGRFDTVYSALYGHAASDAELAKLAKAEKK